MDDLGQAPCPLAVRGALRLVRRFEAGAVGLRIFVSPKGEIQILLGTNPFFRRLVLLLINVVGGTCLNDRQTTAP